MRVCVCFKLLLFLLYITFCCLLALRYDRLYCIVLQKKFLLICFVAIMFFWWIKICNNENTWNFTSFGWPCGAGINLLESAGKIYVAHFHFFGCTISRFGERFHDGTYSLASCFFVVFLLTVLHPRAKPFVQVGDGPMESAPRGVVSPWDSPPLPRVQLLAARLAHLATATAPAAEIRLLRDAIENAVRFMRFSRPAGQLRRSPVDTCGFHYWNDAATSRRNRAQHADFFWQWRRDFTPKQWSFLKTGTTKTLANKAEIGVWVQAPGSHLRIPGVYHPQKNFDIVHAKSYQLLHFGRKMVCSAVHEAFLNALTMGTAFAYTLTLKITLLRRSRSRTWPTVAWNSANGNNFEMRTRVHVEGRAWERRYHC